ncbi:MAG: hypothetical protein ACOX16_03605 [Candidatus Izemoplasmatales bacterium]|jgi:hypothetical protein
MGPVLIGIGILAVLIVLFAVSLYLNAKTAPPESCEHQKVFPACGSCSEHSCLVKASLEMKKQHDRQ